MTADPTKCLTLLLIGDDPEVCSSIKASLTDGYEHVDVGYADTLPDASRKLKGRDRYDVLLIDFPLQTAGEEQLFSWIMNQTNTTPAILLTDDDDSSFVTEVSSLGYSLDYLPKHRMDPFLLKKSIHYCMEHKRFRQYLNKSERQYRELFVINPVPMFIYDMDTYRFLDVNMAAIVTYGYSKKEFLTLTIKDIRPSRDLPKLEKILQEQTVSDELSYRGIFTHMTKKGDLIQTEIQSKFTTVNGKKAKLVLANNVTERLRTQEALRLSEQRFKSLVQDGSDLITILNENGVYQYVSPTSKNVLGISPETFLDTSSLHYIHSEDRGRVIDELADLREKRHIHLSPFRHVDGDDNWRWLESTITYMLDDPAVRGIVTNSRDITEKMEQEMKLRESVARYDIISKATSDTIWDFDIYNDVVTYNEGISDMFGYKQSTIEKTSKWWKDNLHPEERQTVLDKLKEAGKSGESRFQMQYRFRCADGTYKCIYDRAFIVSDENNKPLRIIGAMQDITELMDKKKELQQKNDQLKKAQKIAKLGYWSHNLITGELFWSDETYKLWEIDPQSSAPNYKDLLPYIHPDDRPVFTAARNKTQPSDNSFDAEFRIYAPGGSLKWLMSRITIHHDGEGKPILLEGISQDITENKNQKEKILASLKEKEILLAEIHHRVKNNLAVVSSLMQLQVFREENSELSYKLLDSVSRIKTMAIIHEQLYQSNNFANLEFCQNLKKLVLSIIQTLQSETRITHSFHCNPIQLNINQAVPCALIVNEVVTNILKHAFRGREEGKISICFSQEQNKLKLEISDNGRGMPENLNPASGKTLGLHLIDTLSKQLEADYHFDSSDGKGTRFVLQFVKS